MSNTTSIYEVENLVKATGVNSWTLVGHRGPFPRERGNCFSMSTEHGEVMQVLNFNLENLQELLKRGIISYPIDVLPLKYGTCAIADHRIPSEWYDNEFCTQCTPHEFLPPQQKIKRVIDLKSGKRKETKVSIDGKDFVMIKKESGLEPGYIYAPWLVTDGSFNLLDRLLLLWHRLFPSFSRLRTPSKYKGRKINPDYYGAIKLNSKSE